MDGKKIFVCLSTLFAAILFSTVAACVPFSDNPLTPPDPGKLDGAVFGTWCWKDKNETGFVHIGTDDKSGLLKVIMIEQDNDGELEISEFSGHTSAVGENRYFNLKWVRPESENKGYMFVKYELENDNIVISLLKEDGIEKAIEENILKGEIVREKFVSNVHITDEPEKIGKFFQEKGESLFEEGVALKRLVVKGF